MNYRDMIRSAVAGGPADELPVCPRIDLWYSANKRRGTLPAEYRNASPFEIIEDLDIGYNTTIPDYRNTEKPEDDAFRAVGLFQCRDILYDVAFDVDTDIVRTGDAVRTIFTTPYGNISTESILSEKMKQDGITVRHVSEQAFKDESDYRALCYIFSHARVIPRFERIEALKHAAGSRGVPIGWVLSSASPMHFVQKQLMGFEQFFFEMYDHPDELNELCRAIEMLEDAVFSVMLEAPVDICRFGGNYDSMIQNPPFFREHIMPNLQKRSRALHEKGKLLLTHTDGENKGLMDLYLESEIDIAESFCPAPMTQVDIQEARNRFEGKICLWGGIPSLLLMRELYSEREFEAYLDSFFEAAGTGAGLIISVADTLPPDADFSRLKTIVKRAKAFGPVPAIH